MTRSLQAHDTPDINPSADGAPTAGAPASPKPVTANTKQPFFEALYYQGWRVHHAVASALLVALGVWMTWSGWTDLVWLATHDPESSQILVAPLIGAWLLWTRYRQIAEVGPSFSVVGPLFIACAWLAWELGYYQNIRVASHLAAVGLPLGLLLCVTGDRLFFKLLPVFGVLIFLIPVPHSIRLPLSVPLQRISAQITEHLMLLSGVELSRAGSILMINGANVGVAEACNGMRMVFTVFLVTYFVVFSSDLRIGWRILLLALAPLFALICNIIRLIPTVYLYGYASEDVAELFHDLSGWGMNIVAFLLVMGLLSAIRWLFGSSVTPPPRVAPKPPTAPVHARRTQALVGPALGLAMFGGLAFTDSLHLRPADVGDYHQRVADAMDDLPYALGEWIGRDVPVPTQATELLKPNGLVSRQFLNTRTGQRVSLLLVHTRDARDLIGHYPPECYPASGWQITDRSTLRLPATPANSDIEVANYGFVRYDLASRQTLDVLNVMVLPTGRYSVGMSGLSGVSGDYRVRHFGAAALQLVFSEPVEPEERQAVWEEFYEVLQPALQTIMSGYDESVSQS